MGEPIDFYVNLLAGSTAGLAAVGALKSIDDAAARATGKIQDLETAQAKAQKALSETKDNPGIRDLETRLEAIRQAQTAMRGGAIPYDAKAYRYASEQAAKLEKQLESAKTKQAKAVESQSAKVDTLTKKIGDEKAAHASSASLVAAKRAQAAKAVEEQIAKQGNLLEAAKEAGGPVGALAGKLEGLGKAGAVGAAIAVAVALAAIAAAAVVAVVALTRYAIAAADAARSSALLSAGATGSGSAAWELETVVDQLSQKIPQARQKTAEWARELSLAGIAGRDMQRTLTAMGTVASAVGDQAGSKIKGIAEASRMAQRLMLGARDRFGEFASLQGTGIKAADIYAAVAKSMRTSIPEAKRMVDAGIVPFKRGLEALEQAAETKFGPIVARQMLSLDTQVAKLRENLGKLFGGANIEAFLKGLKTVTDLFDTNTVTGYVLREVFTSVFTSISEVAAKVFPYVRAAIMGVALGVIWVATAAKQLYRQFQQTFGGVGKDVDWLKMAFITGAAAVGGLVGGVLALTLGFVALGAAALVATAPIWIPFVLGAVLVYAMVKAIGALIDWVGEIVAAFDEVDLGKAAENIMNSLIDGIKAKIADVKAAISSVGSAITGAFDSKMEIRSPSKVMTRRAGYIIDPLITEPERRGGEVRAAIGGLGDLDSPRALPQGQGGASQGPTFTFTNCTFGSDMGDVKRGLDEWWATKMLGEARGYAGG